VNKARTQITNCMKRAFPNAVKISARKGPKKKDGLTVTICLDSPEDDLEEDYDHAWESLEVGLPHNIWTEVGKIIITDG